MVNRSYSIEKLLLDIQRGRVEELEEIMAGKATGKNKLIQILEPFSKEPSNSGILKLLRGDISPELGLKEIVEGLAEKQNLKVGKLRKTLRDGLITLLKAKPATTSKMTLVGALKTMIDSPSDELLDRIFTLSKERADIRKDISDAKTNKTELLQAILKTDMGTKKPENIEEFLNSPQVKWLSYSSRFSLGRSVAFESGRKDAEKQTKPPRVLGPPTEEGKKPKFYPSGSLQGFVEMQNYRSTLENEIESQPNFTRDIDRIMGIEVDWPPLYDLIFGKKEAVFEIKKSYKVLDVVDSMAYEYLLLLQRIKNSASLYPKIKGQRLDTKLIKTGQGLNPYLVELLRSESADFLGDTLGNINIQEYLSNDAIDEIVNAGITRKDWVKSDRRSFDYYYSDLYDAIVNVEGSELDDKDKKALSDILEGQFKTQYEGLKSEEGLSTVKIYDKAVSKGKNIVEIPKDSEFSTYFEDIIENETVQNILNRVGIKNPNVFSRQVRLESKRGIDTEYSKPFEYNLREILPEPADKVIYRLALKGDIKMDKNVNYYSTTPDSLVAFQTYYNLLWVYGEGIVDKAEKLNEVVNLYESTQGQEGEDEVEDAVEEFKNHLTDGLEQFILDLNKGIKEKLKDIVSRKEHYENETESGLLRTLRRNLFVAYDDIDLEVDEDD